MKDPLEGLDQDQQKVARHGKGPAMVVAGAGSGKTRALTQRIAHLVSCGVEATSILATTFTRKAATEIRERLESFDVECENKKRKTRGVRVGTLHSTAYEILRSSPLYRSWEPNNDFSDELVRDILKAAYGTLDDAPVTARRAAEFISLAKNHGRLPFEAGTKEDSWVERFEFGYAFSTYMEVYEEFERIRTARKLITYDDMLLVAYLLLRDDEQLRQFWEKRFEYVLVDEAQDTNMVQFGIAERLVELHKNFMVVGDPYQSIYSWRGAYPVYLEKFKERFPDAKRYTMGRNYRCSRNILTYASNVVGHCTSFEMMKGFKLEPVRTDAGVAIWQASAQTQEDASDKVCAMADRLIREGTEASQIAVLYRTRSVGTVMESSILRYRTRYERLDAVPFYDRVVVKTLVNCMSLTENPNWLEAGCQAVDAVRLIGKATLRKLRHAEGDTFLDKCRTLAATPRNRLQHKQRENLVQFAYVIENCAGEDPATTISQIVDHIDFLNQFDRKKLGKEKQEEFYNIEDDVDLLITRASEFATVADFLDHILSFGDNTDDSDGVGRIVLSTIHRIKGLEYKHVFLMSAIEGVIPFSKSMSREDNLDEERRLFYVALTRARDSLTVLTYNRHFDIRTRTASFAVPSRFLQESNMKEIKS